MYLLRQRSSRRYVFPDLDHLAMPMADLTEEIVRGGSWTGYSAHSERLISAPQAKKILAGRREMSDFWLF